MLCLLMGLLLPTVFSQPLREENHGSIGLATWAEVSACSELVLHPATIAAMDEAMVLGYIASAHRLQGVARWVVFLDGSHVLAAGAGGPLAFWAFIVVVRSRSTVFGFWASVLAWSVWARRP